MGYRVLIGVCKSIPAAIAPPILRALGSIYYLLASGPRKTVSENLRRLGIEDSGRDVFHHFSYFLFEFFSQKKAIVQEEEKLLDEFTQHFGAPGEQGGLLLLPHLGNWEVSLRWLLDQGYSVDTIAQGHSSNDVDHVFKKLRHHPRLKVHPLNTGARSCLRALKSNRIIALACERDYSNQGIRVDFEHFHTDFPTGPSWLMGSGNWKTALVECSRQSLLHFKIQIHPFSPSGDLEERTRLLARAIYDIIRRHPLQWITFDPILRKKDP